MNGLHLTLTGIGTFLSVVGAAGAIWRFYIAPWLASQRSEEERTRRFRDEARIWFLLLEEAAPEEVAERRKRLIGELDG